MPTKNFIAVENVQICKFTIYISVIPVTVHAAVDKGCFYFNI
jgi:hypothetical protein